MAIKRRKSRTVVVGLGARSRKEMSWGNSSSSFHFIIIVIHDGTDVLNGQIVSSAVRVKIKYEVFFDRTHCDNFK